MPRHLLSALFAVTLLAVPSTALADGVFYLGSWEAEEESATEAGETPFVIGAMAFDPNSRFVFGADIAREGTMLDSTYGENKLDGALSFNLLLGGNLVQSPTTRVDLAGLIGFRESVADCPDSFLGYQCYADRPPEVEYDPNYGIVLSVSISTVMIGVRHTGESTQALLGFRF